MATLSNKAVYKTWFVMHVAVIKLTVIPKSTNFNQVISNNKEGQQHARHGA